MNNDHENLILDAAAHGQSPYYIVSDALECAIHRDLVVPVRELKARARASGFELSIASGYRDFSRQLTLWNRKARGEAVVLGCDELPLDVSCLNEKEIVFAILRWSALPGASRHHWGTDFDVFDAAAIASDYSLKLTVAETEKDGPFFEFYRWLDAELSSNNLGFYRPYAQDLGGVAREPWHISFKPTATIFQQRVSVASLTRVLASVDLAFKATVLENLEEIYSRFVINVSE